MLAKHSGTPLHFMRYLVSNNLVGPIWDGLLLESPLSTNQFYVLSTAE